jgi:hypothetical protein
MNLKLVKLDSENVLHQQISYESFCLKYKERIKIFNDEKPTLDTHVNYLKHNSAYYFLINLDDENVGVYYMDTKNNSIAGFVLTRCYRSFFKKGIDPREVMVEATKVMFAQLKSMGVPNCFIFRKDSNIICCDVTDQVIKDVPEFKKIGEIFEIKL